MNHNIGSNINSNEMPEGSYRPQGNGPHTTVAGNMFDPAVNADGAMHGTAGVGGTDQQTILKEGQEHIKRTGGVGFDGQPPNVSSNAYDQGYGQSVSSSGQHQEGIDHIRSQAGLGPSDRSGAGYGSSTTGVGYGSTTGSGLGSSTTGSGYGSSTTAGPHSSDLANKADPRVDSDRSESREYSGVNDTSSRSGLTGSNANTRDQHTAGDMHGAGSQLREGTAAGGDDIGKTKHEYSEGGGKTSTGHHVGGYIGNPEMDANTSGPPDTIPMAGNERIGTKHWGESKVIKDTAPRPSESSTTDSATAKNTEHNTGSGHHEGAQKESFVEKIKDKMGMGHHEK